jgi:hypothetical protein
MSQSNGDAAAIMIAAGTIGYSIFSRDGLYAAYDLGLAVAVAIVLAAYIWPSWRTFPQSVAVATILGGCGIPIVGYLIVHFAHPSKDWADSWWDNAISAICWISFGLLALVLDRHQNKTRNP